MPSTKDYQPHGREPCDFLLIHKQSNKRTTRIQATVKVSINKGTKLRNLNISVGFPQPVEGDT